MRLLNNTQHVITVWSEPLGEDYWMQPGEEFEFVRKATDSSSYFQIDIKDQSIKVWAEGPGDLPTLRKDGNLLQCGHNRPAV